MSNNQFRVAIQKQCGFPSILQSAEDERRQELNAQVPETLGEWLVSDSVEIKDNE